MGGFKTGFLAGFLTFFHCNDLHSVFKWMILDEFLCSHARNSKIEKLTWCKEGFSAEFKLPSLSGLLDNFKWAPCAIWCFSSKVFLELQMFSVFIFKQRQIQEKT